MRLPRVTSLLGGRPNLVLIDFQHVQDNPELVFRKRLERKVG